MRGRIIFVHPETNTGLIFGADRERYGFSLDQWSEPGAPPRNTEVGFRIKGDQATQIRPFSQEDEQEMIAELLADAVLQPAKADPEIPPSQPRAKTGRIAPVLDAAPQSEAPSAVDEAAMPNTVDDDLPTGVENKSPQSRQTNQDAPVGEKLSIPANGQILFTPDATGRPKLKYYLFGVLATFVLVLIAYLSRHMLGAQ